jgi:hypothetical protein
MLTTRLRRHVELAFPRSSVAAVLKDLEVWRYPYGEHAAPSERVLAAVVLLAEGDPDGLGVGFRLAAVDWRDLLVTAGLENDDWSAILDHRLLRWSFISDH